MKKVIYTMLLVVVGCIACSEDYTNWAEPQTNEQHEVEQGVTATIIATSAHADIIDFASITTDSLHLFTIEQGQTDMAYVVDITGADAKGIATILATATGRVATSDLKTAIETIYGKAGWERTLQVTVSQMITVNTADGMVRVKCSSEPFAVKAKLVMPVISQAYYLVGSPTTGKSASEMKFQHSGEDVYHDPVFTYTFAGTGSEMWFVFTEQENMSGTNVIDWKIVYGYTGSEMGMSGSFLRRSEMEEAENSFKVNGLANTYQLTINMMENTYEIKILD